MKGIKHAPEANAQGFIWALEDTHNTDAQPEDHRGGGY